ncbi:hypothetical protein C0V70_15560 [Bacteriovorax stolpii]|uniref:Uncharacterized protein n=1 Tax=Bacteriovorax stolpii TaxID=960 RepID=A0A2K9NVG1_BACTC|nr:hypothetical protein [Bacteriovorax stolpii]AUN99496.1 hypothetical protein C0V70_15560 [Bacteriovorax stolpii]TDP51123.1 hypothetical protein C8D79_3293 [Bacteriovorax stolpii]
MGSIRHSIQTNRRLLVLIAGLLVIVAVLLGKFYFQQREENKALRLKILSMSENRRTPKPWSTLTSVSNVSTSALTAPVNAPVQPLAASATTPAQIETPPVVDQDTQTLAVTLTNQMRRPKNLDVKTLDQNIAIADEIISREPDSYSAYKAKLISLLVKEGKFNQPANEDEIESLLEDMAQFNIGNNSLARREATLIANTNADIDNIDNQLNALGQEREMIESQLNGLAADSPELLNANDRLAQIEEKEAMLMSNVESLETSLASNRAQIINEDVVEIPFMRLLAKNDYESVMSNAQTFIDQFPNSPSGYYYMVRALELQGQKAEALNLIQNSRLSPEVQESLLQRLQNESSQDPKNYWQKLSF